MAFARASYDVKDLTWRGTSLYVEGRRSPVAQVVSDSVYPLMWRVRLPDGSLSDMVNLSRAKDAAITLAFRSLNTGKNRRRASGNGSPPMRQSEEAA